MGQLKYTNNARSELAVAIAAGATSITVTAREGAEFPVLLAGDHFYATLQDTLGNVEIVKVTARVADVFTVLRGQDGTTARAFAIADTIGCRMNRAFHEENAQTEAMLYAIALGH